MYKEPLPRYIKARLGPFDFAAELIVRLRNRVKHEEDLADIDISTRQGLNLLRFLSAILMRQGQLKNADYIKAAAKTAPPELQKLTRTIAAEILYPKEEEEIEEEPEEEKVQIKKEFAKEPSLDELFANIPLMDAAEIDSYLEQDRERYQRFLKFKEKILTQKDEPYRSLCDLLRFVNRLERVMEHFDNFEEVLDNLLDEIVSALGTLTPTELQVAKNLGLEPRLMAETPRLAEQLGWEYLNNSPQFYPQLLDTFGQITSEDAFDVLDMLKELGADVDAIFDRLWELSSNLHDVKNISDAFNKIGDHVPDSHILNSMAQDPDTAFKLAKTLDTRHPTHNLTPRLMDLADHYDFLPSVEPLLQELDERNPQTWDKVRHLIQKHLNRPIREQADLFFPTEPLDIQKVVDSPLDSIPQKPSRTMPEDTPAAMLDTPSGKIASGLPEEIAGELFVDATSTPPADTPDTMQDVMAGTPPSTPPRDTQSAIPDVTGDKTLSDIPSETSRDIPVTTTRDLPREASGDTSGDKTSTTPTTTSIDTFEVATPGDTLETTPEVGSSAMFGPAPTPGMASGTMPGATPGETPESGGEHGTAMGRSSGIMPRETPRGKRESGVTSESGGTAKPTASTPPGTMPSATPSEVPRTEGVLGPRDALESGGKPSTMPDATSGTMAAVTHGTKLGILAKPLPKNTKPPDIERDPRFITPTCPEKPEPEHFESSGSIIAHEKKLSSDLSTLPETPLALRDPSDLMEIIKHVLEKKEQLSYQAKDTNTSLAGRRLGYELDDSLKKATFRVLEHTNNPQDFKNYLRQVSTRNLELPLDKVLQLGREAGVPEQEIYQILNPTRKHLKRMIEQHQGTVDDFDHLIRRLNLNKEEMRQFTKLALEHQNYEAVQILASKDLLQAIDVASHMSEEAQHTLISSVSLSGDTSTGMGPNLLEQWYEIRNHLTPDSRRIFKRIVTKILIELSIRYGKRMVGSRIQGIIPAYQTRPFQPGDDFSSIDIEATMEHLINQGKKQFTSLDDILVHQEIHGRACFTFLVDISGSMSGEKLAACSLASMVLVSNLKPTEVALATFQSNTQVVKEFDDDKDLEEVAEFLLELCGGGGTMISRALEWAHNQFKMRDDTDVKILIIASDFYFADEGQLIPLFQKHKKQDVTGLFFIYPEMTNLSCIDHIRKVLASRSIYIHDYRSLPKKLTKAMNELFN